MKKISTLFQKDPNDLSRVINVVNPENEWVFFDPGVKATRKFDGTACAIINGILYKRYDVKKGRQVPFGAVPCQEPDPITGHWPHWVRVNSNDPADKWAFEALEDPDFKAEDGTYELCGPKVQGNPEKFEKHTLVRHGNDVIDISIIDWIQLHLILESMDIEGIVFHHPDGRMCKIRKSDLGIKR